MSGRTVASEFRNRLVKTHKQSKVAQGTTAATTPRKPRTPTVDEPKEKRYNCEFANAGGRTWKQRDFARLRPDSRFRFGEVVSLWSLVENSEATHATLKVFYTVPEAAALVGLLASKISTDEQELIKSERLKIVALDELDPTPVTVCFVTEVPGDSWGSFRKQRNSYFYQRWFNKEKWSIVDPLSDLPPGSRPDKFAMARASSTTPVNTPSGTPVVRNKPLRAPKFVARVLPGAKTTRVRRSIKFPGATPKAVDDDEEEAQSNDDSVPSPPRLSGGFSRRRVYANPSADSEERNESQLDTDTETPGRVAPRPVRATAVPVPAAVSVAVEQAERAALAQLDSDGEEAAMKTPLRRSPRKRGRAVVEEEDLDVIPADARQRMEREDSERAPKMPRGSDGKCVVM